MVRRLILAMCVTALVLLPASKKNVGSGNGENQELRLSVTLYIDPADIKELVGSDLGSHYFVADVKVEPKYGKTVMLDRDDFLLRTDKDGEKAKPFAPSQVVGRNALIVGQVTDNTGVGSPGWTGATGPVIRSGGASSGGDTSRPQAKGETTGKGDAGKDDPIKKTLEERMLPNVKTDKPVSGLLYIPMEKQKMKDLELTYGDKDNRIVLRFKSAA
jgi:hypothetical protein